MQKWFPLSAVEIFGIAGVASLVLTVFEKSGASSGVSSAVSIAVFFGASISWAISRLWQYEGNRFKLVLENQGGDLVAPLYNVREEILATHFGTVVPSRGYIAQMLEKMDQGVQITRIIGGDAQRGDSTPNWLNEFRRHDRYSEYGLSSAILPFDFTIYDDRHVVLYLPTNAERNEFNQALLFNNPKLALIFRGIFERMKRESARTTPLGATGDGFGPPPVLNEEPTLNLKAK